MGTQPESDEPSSRERNDALRYAIGHSNHLHITLDNLADLANVKIPGRGGDGSAPLTDPVPLDDPDPGADSEPEAGSGSADGSALASGPESSAVAGAAVGGGATPAGGTASVPYARLLETWAPPVGSPPVVWPDPLGDPNLLAGPASSPVPVAESDSAGDRSSDSFATTTPTAIAEPDSSDRASDSSAAASAVGQPEPDFDREPDWSATPSAAPPGPSATSEADPEPGVGGASEPAVLVRPDLVVGPASGVIPVMRAGDDESRRNGDLGLESDLVYAPPPLPLLPLEPPPAAPAGESFRPGGGGIWTAPVQAVTTGQTPAVTDGRPPSPPQPLALPEPEPARPSASVPALREAPTTSRVRRGWARPSERWLLEALALAAASIAFIAPSAWLVTVVVICIVGGILAFVGSGKSVLSLPRRALYRAVTLLHPRSSMWLPVLVARVVVLAIVLPAAVASVAWLTSEGTTGLAVAARAGAWTHGLRTAVVIVCLMLLTSVGEGRYQRSAAARRWATDISDGALLAFTLGCVALAVVVIGVLPHPSDAWAARADGLGWLPPAARTRADRVRDDIVTAELDSIASCLSSHGDTVWHATYTSGNPLSDLDIAHLQASTSNPDDSPGSGDASSAIGGVTSAATAAPADLATAIIAAHNQLAPWVETIEVGWDEQSGATADPVLATQVRIDRSSLPRNPPPTDASLLATAATSGREWLDATAADDGVALRCSAASPATVL